MANDNKRVYHKRSSVSGKLPTADVIEYGEIAINYADGGETISIKNSANEIVTFSSDDLIIEKVKADADVDTKVTNTLATTTKAYVTGTTTATTNTGTQVFDTGVYLDTTAGQLTATTFKGALSGNATTATTLATARTINGTSFDGSANITTAQWGTARNVSISDSDGTNTGTAVSVNGSSAVTLKLPSTIKATLSGNATTASSATKLSTARTISLSGDATGSASFDGSADATISTTLANSGVTAGSYGPSENVNPAHEASFNVPYITVDAKGRVTSASTKTITLPPDEGGTYSAGDGLTLNGSEFTLNTATSTDLGGVKLGSDTEQTVSANDVTTTSNRTYAIQTNSSGQMVVNVPWTNTNTDTKVTNTLSTTTQAYITGTSSNATNTGTQVFDTGVYLTTTAGQLHATTFDGSGANLTSLNASNISSGTLAAARLATSGVSSGSYGPSANASPSHGGTFSVPYVTVDSYGRVTSASTKTITLPADSNTDTKVTNTVSTSTSNVYITGTSSNTTNTGTQLFSTSVSFVPSTGYVYANAFYESSDKTLKENIAEISDTDKSKNVELKEFSFKSDETHTKKYGVIAQELEEVGLENLVTTNSDGIKSVDYISLLCLKNAQLEEKVRTLEENLAELVKRIELLEIK